MTMTPQHPIALERLAQRIADEGVVADIVCNCMPHTDAAGQLWYDTRTALDPREQPAACIDMFREALEYALRRGLAIVHPEHAHLVRILRRGE